MGFLRQNETDGFGNPEEAGILVHPWDGRGRNVDSMREDVAFGLGLYGH